MPSHPSGMALSNLMSLGNCSMWSPPCLNLVHWSSVRSAQALGSRVLTLHMLAGTDGSPLRVRRLLTMHHIYVQGFNGRCCGAASAG